MYRYILVSLVLLGCRPNYKNTETLDEGNINDEVDEQDTNTDEPSDEPADEPAG